MMRLPVARTLLLMLLLTLPAWAIETPDGAAVLNHAWFVCQLQGHKVGYAEDLVYEKDGRIYTLSEMKLTIRRGPLEVAVSQATTFIETADHVPVQIESQTKTAGMATVVTMDFDAQAKEVKVTRSQFGKPVTTTQPWPTGDWMTPEQAWDYTHKQVLAGAKEITVSVLDGSSGLQVVDTTMQRVGDAKVDLVGRTAPGVEWTSRVSLMPSLKTTVFTDLDGRTLRTQTAVMPGMDMTVIRADKALALSPNDPAELMLNTMIKSDKHIADPRGLRTAKFQLAPKQPGMLKDLQLPTTAVQRCERDGETLVVTVDLDAPAKPETLTPEQRQACLKPSLMLDSDDDAVQALLKKSGVQAMKDDDAKARALTQFVRRSIASKNLSVGLATASEVARTLEGDCTEHAVLLAALLRAAGVPSRCVSGITYADGFMQQQQIFAYHMWTQAYLDGRWVDLDAALPFADGQPPFDATHIALDVDPMDEDQIQNMMLDLIPLMNRFSVSVLEAKP